MVTEAHVRLQEYNRLAERGVPPDVLAEHAEGVSQWYDRYSDALRSPTLKQWADKHFGDIQSLTTRYLELGGTLL
jgi:hypothetical protein